MRFWVPICVAVAIAACAPQLKPETAPVASRPFIVPTMAVDESLRGWTESAVNACLGAPKSSDVIAGAARYFYQRADCATSIIYRDGRVLSVEGYGAEQECWWLVESCERGQEYQPNARIGRTRWLFDEVKACFGEPELGTAVPEFNTEGCRLNLDLRFDNILWIYSWSDTEAGACKRLLRKCADYKQNGWPTEF